MEKKLSINDNVEKFNNVLHSQWVERYRPTALSDLALSDKLRPYITSYIEKQEVPNMILYGEAGTGKNSIVNVLLNTIDNVHLFINASSENGIDMIRQKAEQFALSASWNGKIKILVLNEADQLSPDAQGALRDLLENCMKTCRFIFTCNNYDKITSPLKSRCISFEVKSTSKDIAKRLINIYKQENVEFDEKFLLRLIKTYNTDIRKMIEISQSIYEAHGKLSIQYLDDKDLEEYKPFFDMIIKNPNCNSIKDINNACKNEIFTTNIYTLLKDYICANFDIPELIICLADYAYKDRVVYDRDLNFMSCILDIKAMISANN